MDECFLSATQDDGSLLCLAPLTDNQIAASDIEIDDLSGVYLFEERGSDGAREVRVLARVMSEAAALRIQNTFNLR
tara:strand:- start:1958 stop:2185 length:228 start_codon:yes stop_codon:yes gene_type:complete